MPRKLTDAQVREILSSSEMQIVLAARYGVNPATISLIKTGQTYRHLTRPYYRERNGFASRHPLAWFAFTNEELAKAVPLS